MEIGKTVVLITGASSGLGKETARRLIKEGYVVYGAARRAEKMQDLAELGGHTLSVDVTAEEDLAAAVERINREQGGVDILINNAGFGLYGPVEEVSLDRARYQFEVNLFGAARLVQLVLPHMRQQGFGKIVNVSSMGGKIYTPLGAWYHASKHALEGWSDCLRLELRPLGIDVIIIEPGLVETDFPTAVEDAFPQVSLEGPYSQMAKVVHDRIARGVDRPHSPPSVVANTIYQAIQAKRPRTRYPTGNLARPMILLRTLLPDRLFDFILSRMVN